MLKRAGYKTRSLFLETFTQELILNSKPRVEAFIGEKIIEEPKGVIGFLPSIITKPLEKTGGGGIGKAEGPSISGAGGGGIGGGESGQGGGAGAGGGLIGGGSRFSGAAATSGFGGGQATQAGAGGGPSGEPIAGAKEIEKPAGGINLYPSILTTGLSAFTAEISSEQKTGADGQIISKETSPELVILKQKLTERGPIKPYIIPLSEESQKIQAKFTAPNVTSPKFPSALPSTLPSYLPIGEINLGKLNVFLKDKAITTIECPGPERFVTIKKAGQINLTKITLSQKEINDIVADFSEKTRIPIIGGIFKASIGELTIMAVISEFVGSRFIIYKASPYGLLDPTEQLRQAQLQAQFQRNKNFKIPNQ